MERTQEGKAIAKQREDYREGRPAKFTKRQLTHALSLLEKHSYGYLKKYCNQSETNCHNGQVTIAEAKAAGFKMPITRDSWLYKYMDEG